MGLSSLPAPLKGVICVLLVLTAFFISIVKGIIESILHIVRTHRSSSSSSSSDSDYFEYFVVSYDINLPNANVYIEEVRSRIPPIRFDAACSCKWPEHDCSICLTQFEPESEVYGLSCGHLFHKVCLEKWLNYWNVTCPICRTAILPEDDPSLYF